MQPVNQVQRKTGFVRIQKLVLAGLISSVKTARKSATPTVHNPF